MFGKNSVYSQKEFIKNDNLEVISIFHTIQGEGPFAGFPAVFVRLAKCHLKCNFCIEENQRVLLSDFRYKKIKDLEVGDEILGLSKDNDKKSNYYRLKPQKVLNVMSNGYKPIIDVRSSNNTLKCTSDHRIMISEFKSRFIQAKNTHNKPAFTIRFTDPDTLEFKRGWLSGFADGDGNFHMFKKRWMRFKATSRDTDILDYFEQCCIDLNYTIPIRRIIHNSGVNNNFGILETNIAGIECTQSKEVEKFKLDIEYLNLGVSNSDYLKGYIAGFFDAEGSSSGIDIRISQNNTKNIAKLNKLRYALNQCGISYSEQPGTSPNMTILCLNNKLDFFSYIQPVCERKRNSFQYETLTNTSMFNDTLTVNNSYEHGNVYDITTEFGNFICEGLIVHNCDTDFESNIKSMSVSDTIQEVMSKAKKNTHLVVITGGEPMLQPKVAELVTRLIAGDGPNMLVQMETSGGLFLDGLPYDDNSFSIVCSPKTGKISEKLEPHINAFKYVMSADNVESDGLPKWCSQGTVLQKLARPKAGSTAEIYLAPMDEYDVEKNKANQDMVVKMCLEFGYILSLQVHKIIGVE